MIENIKLVNRTINSSERKKFIIFFSMSFLIPFLEFLSIASLGALILFVVDLENSIKLVPIQSIQELIGSMDKVKLVFILSSIVLILIVLKNIFLLFYAYFESKLKKEIGASHSAHILKQYINKDFIDLVYLDTSEIQNDILNQARKISEYFIYLITLIKDSFLALFLIAGLFLVNFKITFFLILVSIIMSIFYFILTNKKVELIGKLASLFEGELVKVTQNIFVGIKSIIVFSKQKFFQNKFIEIITKKIRNEIWFETISKLPRLVLEIVFAICIVLFINYSIKSEGDISKILPFLVFLSLVSIRMLPVFSNLNLILANLKHSEIVVKRLSKFWDTEHKIREKSTILKKKDYKDFNYIELKNVSFSYSINNIVINNLDFKFEKGKVYALTGVSGSGKSTLIDIISGFLKPTKGHVEVNNENVYEGLEFWRHQVAFVPQDNFLINDTIAANISFGEFDEQIDTKNLNDSIDKSNLRNFVNELPKKEKTLVGDRGINISGGQRQRIGLARALYRNRNFIALDEATSSIDQESEFFILNTLHKIKKDKIIIIIAHRQSTISLCDETIHLNKGIIEKKD